MSAKKPRWETSRVWYAVYWVLSVWVGLGFLGGLAGVLIEFPRSYAQDKSLAFENLGGVMIIGLVLAFLCRRVIRIHMALKAQGANARG